MNILYNGKEYPILIIKKNNKNTYIRVRDDKVIITTNYFVSKKYLERLVNDNYNSIVKMIDNNIKKNTRDKKFILFGKEYKIVINDEVKNIEIINDTIYVKDEKKLNNWLNDYIKSVFTNHLLYSYELFTESIPKPDLRIRSMKTRWGVCNTKTHIITLNKELYRYDISCLDYVCIHELSHLIHPNHSKSFWLVVSKYCPDYKKIKKKLNCNE